MESGLQNNENLGNGDHFLNLLRAETGRLTALSGSAEQELETDDTMPEEIRGKLRIGIGKAKMLLKKKFIQFEELCFKNLGIKSDVRYPVTCEDLAGFWDTIVIQIIQVYKIFDEVEVLRKNNWEEPVNPNPKREIKKIQSKLSGDNAINESIRAAELNTQVI